PASPAGPSPVVLGPASTVAAGRTEVLAFGEAQAQKVSVVRGANIELASLHTLTSLPGSGRIETVRFGEAGGAVNVVRGGAAGDDGLDLFAPAKAGELDRVAFAVDGAESGHGSNFAMWRADPDGPQGPMQVSAAAAFDVGGGDRFDMRQNRAMGRAYLALLYQRYGNWPDAIAAYNWGPGNLDQWIGAGRPVDRLPLETARYLLKVLRDALLVGPS
ncbi:MAG: lytic transglycosylase domain-containing protein, partial [Alphaproteobacteria bacterium]|nr:lytic transglycosylase domain-containing protein [Alphaproteobacteria bacterium]